MMKTEQSASLVRLQPGKFLIYLRLLKLRRILSGIGIWTRWYLAGIAFLYAQFIVAILVLALEWSDIANGSTFIPTDAPVYELLVNASYFVLLATITSTLVIIAGIPLGVFIARMVGKRGEGFWGQGVASVFDVCRTIADLPIVFWILILIPALPESNEGQRLTLYWASILILVFIWSVFEIAREVIRQSREPFVPSLRNLGVSEAKIYSLHILLGGCREFIMALIFNIWMMLLLIEISVGLASQFTSDAIKSTKLNLIPYTTSFGELLAAHLRSVYEAPTDSNIVIAAIAMTLLAFMFLSYWMIQVGILSVRQAGGMEYLEAADAGKT